MSLGTWWLKVTRRRSLEQDLADEIAFHRAMREGDVDPPPFGDPARVRDGIRDLWSLGWLDALLADARYALRGLRRDRAFAATAIALLALAIGANTAMFVVLKRAILDPLPYPDADRLVRIYDFHKERGFAFSVTALNYLDWAAETRAFEQLAAYSGQGLTITGQGEPELVIALGVTPNLPRTLGVAPALGRDFRTEESTRGRDRVIVLTDALWKRKFGADPSVVGRQVRVNGASYEVIGVMPAGFAYPDASYEALVPLALQGGDPDWINRSRHHLRVVGRLRPSESVASARVEMDGIAGRLESAYPEVNAKLGVQLRALKDTVVGDARQLVVLLYGAATVLLLIACANLASLLVARASARRQELATRLALGASRARLAAQMLVEAGVLGLLGGGAGLGLAALLIHGLRTAAAASLPRMDELSIDPAILGFSIALTLATVILFGLGPAFFGARAVGGARGAAAHGLRRRVRQALVVAQVAMSLVLLAGAGLFLRSLHNLRQADRGFDADGVVTMSFALNAERYPSADAIASFARRFGDGLAASPSLGAAGFSTRLPLSGQGWGNPVAVEGRAPVAASQSNIARIQGVSPGFLETLRMRVVLGRTVTASDDARAPAVAVVDETFVRTFLGGAATPLGERIKIGDADSSAPWLTVVGVVAASRQFSLEASPEAHVFAPYFQLGSSTAIVGRGIYVAARGATPAETGRSMRSAITALDPLLAVRGPDLLAERVDTALAPARFRTSLMIGFAALALVLASVGLYGVIAFAVAQRTQEIGVRIALGARGAQILAMVLASGAQLAALGIALGLAGALALSTFLDRQQLLFGVGARDGLTLAAVAVGLGLVSLVASLVPARRAARIDPMRALRTE
jgi:putative ABC transport system permease protein